MAGKVNLLDFSEIRFAAGTDPGIVDPDIFLNPPYFFGRVPIDAQNLLPMESTVPYAMDMSELYDSLLTEVRLFVNRSAFMKMSLKEISRFVGVGPLPAGDLEFQRVDIEAEEVDFEVHGSGFKVAHQGIEHFISAESSRMFHEIHDISCLLIFGVREAEVPRLGEFRPDFNRDGLIMEMKTYRDPRYALHSIRSQLHKYAQQGVGLARVLRYHGVIVSESSWHHSVGCPQWVLDNCNLHAPFISGLIVRSREIHADSFDSEYFEDVFEKKILPNLPQDPLVDYSDYMYVTEETIEECSKPSGGIPSSLHDSFVRSFNLQPVFHDEKKFTELNISGSNRFGGRFTNIPILRRSCHKTFYGMTRPHKAFSLFAWDLHQQAEKEGKIFRSFSDLPETQRTLEVLQEDPKFRFAFKEELRRKSDKKRSEELRVDLKSHERHADYLSSRGRCPKDHMASPMPKEPSKWFSLASDFGCLERFLRYEWFRSFTPQPDEFDSLNESDNGTGAKDIWEHYKSTHMFSFTDICSRIFSEVSMSIQHFMCDGGFEVKEVQEGLFVIISSKGHQKPVFIQIYHDSSFIHLDSNDLNRLEVCGDFTYYEGFTVHPDRLSNWFNLTEKIFAISQVQCEIEKIGLVEMGVQSPTALRIAVITATMLEANEQTQSTLTNIRYAGMECLSGKSLIDPFKILEKMDHFPRTLLGAWILKNFIASTRMMINTRPRMEFQSSAEELQQDSLSDYICWMTMTQTRFLLVALNGWYVHSATELVNGDRFQASAVILEKLYDAEKKLRLNESLDPSGQINCGQRDYVFNQDFPVMCSFDRKFVTWSCEEYILKMKGRHPDYITAMHRKICSSIAKVTLLELCTLKSSVKVGMTDEALKGNVKTKVCLNMLDALETILNDQIDPFENVGRLIDYVERYGNYISLFRKVQKGTREILILSFPMRLLQKLIEIIAVSIASFSDSEMLTHPKSKEAMIRRHRAVEARMIAENYATATSYSSCDATTWCQGLTAKVLYHFLFPFLPTHLIRPVGRIMNLMTKKKLALPKELLLRFGNYVADPTGRVMQDGLRRLYEGMSARDCFTDSLTHLVNRSNMGQGILHTPSSLAHDIALCGLFSYLKKIFPERNVHVSYQVSSDDSGFIITNSVKIPEEEPLIDELLKTWSRFVVESYPLFSAKSSMKSTVDCRNPIYEFNSVWQVSNFTAALSMKQIRACFATRLTSFDRKIDEMANNRRSLPNFGCSSQTVACVQIAQARTHYKTLGLFTQFSEILRAILFKMRHPVFGLFPFEPEKVAGLLGGGYALYRLMSRDPVCKATQGMIYLHPSVSVKENGQPTLNIHFTPNSMVKFEAFNKKLKDFERRLLPFGWRNTVSDKPDLLFDKYPKERAALLCSIFRKIDSKKMTESFVTDGIHQTLGSIAYLFTSRCLTVVEDGAFRKESFLDLSKMDRTSSPTYEHRFDFVESYAIADQILLNYERTYSVMRAVRPSVRSSVKVVSEHERIRNNLLSTALRYWSKTANDAIVINFLEYCRKYPWLRQTFQDTMQAVGKDAVGLLDLISVRPDKETTYKVLCPRPPGATFGDLAETYIANPRPGVYLRSEVENLADFCTLRMDLNGMFTRAAMCIGRVPDDMSPESNAIINAAYARYTMFGSDKSENAMWRGIIASTTNAVEKKFHIGLALFRNRDMAHELVETMRDFSFYEEIGAKRRTKDGTVWGRSTLFLKTQGHSFRISTDEDTAEHIVGDAKALNFLSLAENHERLLNHLKLLGITSVLKDERNRLYSSVEELPVQLRISSLTMKQDCPNLNIFRGPVRIDFQGYKSRIDNLPQTAAPSFRINGSNELVNSWVNGTHMGLGDFWKAPKYLGEFFRCYEAHEEDERKEELIENQMDLTDEIEVVAELKKHLKDSSFSLRERTKGLTLQEILTREVSTDRLKELTQGLSSEETDEDDDSFDYYSDEEVQTQDRIAELSLRVNPDLLAELSREPLERARSRDLINKCPPGLVDLFRRMEAEKRRGWTDNPILAISLGLDMGRPEAPMRVFD